MGVDEELIQAAFGLVELAVHLLKQLYYLCS